MYLLIIIMEGSKFFPLSFKIKMDTQKIFFSQFVDSLVTRPQNGPPALIEVISPSSSGSSPTHSSHR